jgi:hypothetical protein
MKEWKQSFAEKLSRVQSQWGARLDDALDHNVQPVYEDLADFVRKHGFSTSVPLHEVGRRSFKFELAEDAYVLLIFKTSGMGDFELSCETFVLGTEPKARKVVERLGRLTEAWARQEFQATLNAFVELLGGAPAPQEEPALVA